MKKKEISINHVVRKLGISRYSVRYLIERGEITPSGKDGKMFLNKDVERLQCRIKNSQSKYNPVKANFTFIDLFAGIGGFRIAFSRQGGLCKFTSEYDNLCKTNYTINFGDDNFYGDIRLFTGDEIDDKKLKGSIPDHDILTAGFPCQPFSLAGVSKKNSLGRAHGFECETQGTLFFDILRILKVKRPPMFLLENVKNLISHDKGNTFRVIKGALDEAGYWIEDEIIDAQRWVPQHRERIFIVGFSKNIFNKKPEFPWPRPIADKPVLLGNILEKNPDKKYILTDHLWKYLKDYKKKHEEQGNGFGYGICTDKSVARTLSARYHKDGSEILIDRGPRSNPRRLTPYECASLMGFP